LAAAAAAAVLVVDPPLGLWPSWLELSADYRTATGEQRQITLAEDVSISLNTQTSIALRSAGGASDRIELIAGEAMVSTLPQPSRQTSRLFTVVAGNGQTAATGDARFNLRRSEGSVCVTCLQGDVSVQCGAAQLQLPAGRQVIYSARGIEPPVAADLAMVTAWQDGIVIFDATPLAEVVVEINRYRPGRIILANAALGQEKFSARFRIANIDRVLGQIEQVFGAKVTALPGGIMLLG
jgi:transmembrane sensor